MLYTTNLIRLTRKVNLTGFIENHAVFIDENGRKSEGVFSNETLSKLLNFERAPLTIECEKDKNIECIQIPNPGFSPDDVKINHCPSCGIIVKTNYCWNEACNGRRVDNFRKVLSLLGILYSGNESLLRSKSKLRVENVLKKDYCDEKYIKSPKVTVANELIDNVIGMYYVPVLFIIARICSLSEEETELLVDHVKSESDLVNLHLTDLINHKGIKRLHDYLSTPLSNWVTELEVRYK